MPEAPRTEHMRLVHTDNSLCGRDRGGESCNVVVGVRVRPMAKFELPTESAEQDNDRGRACLRVHGRNQCVVNERTFQFDEVFDSLDPKSSTYASQRNVYHRVGTLVHICPFISLTDSCTNFIYPLIDSCVVCWSCICCC